MMDFEKQGSEFRAGSHFFARGRPVFIGRSPGRLDLMGGNVDYTGGLVFEATIREATWAAAQLRTDHRVVLVNPQMSGSNWRDRVEVPLDVLRDGAAVRTIAAEDPALRWTAYVLGVFHCLVSRWPAAITGGATLYLSSEVPLNKGVSSSAAVEVASMKAAAAIYGIARSEKHTSEL